jgi:exopolysaccharide/PEP-CTERM locus tyrosine autokinase
MSTIERAAARLGSIGKPRLEPALGDGAGPDRAAAPQMFVGGGLVQIDLDALAERGFVGPADAKSELATDFRRIKRPLLLAMQKAEALGELHNPANLVVVTSALPSEGKTFVSVNLALSMATEMDRTVLLIDGDPAKGDVCRVLGIEPSRGFTEILEAGGHYIDDAILKTNIEDLAVLPSGPRLPNTDELFASELTRRVTRQLAEDDRNRIILVDAPPLLASTEAAALARLAGQVVVVVEADRTPQANVTEALALLDGCEGVSLVLNKVTRRASDRHAYGYGYGHSHGVGG